MTNSDEIFQSLRTSACSSGSTISSPCIKFGSKDWQVLWKICHFAIRYPVVTIEGDGDLEGTLFMALGMIVANWSQLSFISRPDVLVSSSCLSSQMLPSKVRFITYKKCYTHHFYEKLRQRQPIREENLNNSR